MSPIPKPCQTQGCPNITTRGPRCPRCHTEHQRGADARRGTTTARGYGHQWKTTARATLDAWRHDNGDWCPGWDVPAHESSDLVVDHDAGPMCRSCNSRKAATFDKARKRMGEGG